MTAVVPPVFVAGHGEVPSAAVPPVDRSPAVMRVLCSPFEPAAVSGKPSHADEPVT